jgi:hypothetical protein
VAEVVAAGTSTTGAWVTSVSPASVLEALGAGVVVGLDGGTHVTAVSLTALTTEVPLAGVLGGGDDGVLESLAEALGVGLGDTESELDGGGVELGVQVGVGDVRVGSDPAAEWDGDGEGELVGFPPAPDPLCGFEFPAFELLGDTAVETLSAT